MPNPDKMAVLLVGSRSVLAGGSIPTLVGVAFTLKSSVHRLGRSPPGPLFTAFGSGSGQG